MLSTMVRPIREKKNFDSFDKNLLCIMGGPRTKTTIREHKIDKILLYHTGNCLQYNLWATHTTGMAL